MALPADLELGHVHGRYISSEGAPMEGFVQFTLSIDRLVDNAEETIIIPVTHQEQLVGGEVDVDLPANDDMSPASTYKVIEQIPGGKTYTITVLAGQTVELAAVSPHGTLVVP